MPELPEVEVIRQSLIPVVKNKVITSITTHRPNLRYPFPKNFSQELQGAKIADLKRRGKYLILTTNIDKDVIIHLGMSGKFLKSSPKTKHTHVTFEFENSEVLQYEDPRRFGFMDLVKKSELRLYSSFYKMGPEPLDESFTSATLGLKLAGRKTPIKTALLNQEVVAGLGNIYVCEALAYAKISPHRPAYTLKPDELENLTNHIKRVLKVAIKAGGSTLKDYKTPSGSSGYFQHDFKVYNQKGKGCFHGCGNVIESAIQSGRSTFYCASCQQ